ncbi:hypothetical protein Barb4_02599 [Bacteroidales bacterium Barb4]|nr:hypothetical protein Barb4_02599 [Bacteroidales bacterium Barb4]
MPMKKLSTRCVYSSIRKRNIRPSKQTLDFLIQFARVYKAEPALPQDICAYVLN